MAYRAATCGAYHSWAHSFNSLGHYLAGVLPNETRDNAHEAPEAEAREAQNPRFRSRFLAQRQVLVRCRRRFRTGSMHGCSSMLQDQLMIRVARSAV